MRQATLYLGDCVEVMRGLEAESVDAVITDPPYCSGGISEAARTAAKGQGLRSENIRRFGWFVGDNMTTAGLAWLLRLVAIEGLRLLKPSGHLLVFMDWRLAPTLIPAIESSGVRYQGLVVWDKGSMGLGVGFRSQHELVAHFTCGAPLYHDASRGNVLRHPRVTKDEREHQTQKPVELLADLVEVTTPEGGVIADPFMGSGSMGVSALRLRRSFIGMERDPTHVDTAVRRIREDAPMFNRVEAVL